MNSAATAAAPGSLARTAGLREAGAESRTVAAPGPAPLWSERIGIRPRHLVVLAAALLYPFIASPFFTYQIGAQSLALGLIALSLTFLGGYGAWSHSRR